VKTGKTGPNDVGARVCVLLFFKLSEYPSKTPVYFGFQEKIKVALAIGLRDEITATPQNPQVVAFPRTWFS
jgi:hypothetical protein